MTLPILQNLIKINLLRQHINHMQNFDTILQSAYLVQQSVIFHKFLANFTRKKVVCGLQFLKVINGRITKLAINMMKYALIQHK